MRAIWANVKKDEFWNTNFVHMVEPILMSLKTFDSKQPCTGRAWFIVKSLEGHVLSLQDPTFEFPLNLANVIENQFYRKCRNPTLKECEDETHIPEMGTWESSGTPKSSEFDCKGQNTSH